MKKNTKKMLCNNKIAVYTCITGDYDNLKEIPTLEEGIDYYCFTNNKKIKSNTWNVIYIDDENLSNVQLARKIKILGHELINDYDILLWMDGAVTFKKNIKDFINTYLDKKDVIVGFIHGERDNIKDEANACYRFDKESKENINKILKFYKDENYPFNNGLIESTVYIKRPKDKIVQETMKLWFSMILNYSTRDQLSFNYCIYKTGLKVKWINEKVFSNKWFNWENHNLNNSINTYSIYFGDISKYDLERDTRGKYKVKENNYSFKEKILLNTDRIYITASNVSCIYFKNIKINDKKPKNYKIYNLIKYNNLDLIYTDEFIIELIGDFKKDDEISFSVDMYKLTEDEKLNLIKDICDNNINYLLEKEKLESKNKSLEEYINKLWKTINSSYICRFGLKLKRSKDI